MKYNKMNDLIRNVLINHKILDWFLYWIPQHIHVFNISYCKLLHTIIKMHLNVYFLMTDSAWNSNEKVKAYSEIKPCHVKKKKNAYMQVDMY